MNEKDFVFLCKNTVAQYANEHMDKSDGKQITEDDVFIVWMPTRSGRTSAYLSARNKMKPWDDARTYRREFEVRKITAQDIIDAVEKMKQLPVTASYIYYFRTDWVKPYVSEEDCIQYFADNGSVIVIDHQGREWWKGVKL